MQAEEMATVWPEGGAWPAAPLQQPDDLQISGQAVAMDRIKNQDVSVAPQSAMPVEQIGLGRREQRFASGDRGCVAPRYRSDRFEVQRIANVLEPPQLARGKRIGGLK